MRSRTPSSPRWTAGRARGCRAAPSPGSSRPPATGPSTPSAPSAPARGRRRRACGCWRAPRPTTLDSIATDTPDPRRAARADLRLLPPVAGPRRPGAADAAAGGRADRPGDRPRPAAARGDGGPAAGARQAQDPRRRASRSASRRPTSCPERIGAVLAVLYLTYTEGYSATGGPGLRRDDVAEEAIRLAEALRGLMPDEAEPTALLALMTLHHARRRGAGRRRRSPGPAAATRTAASGTAPPSTAASRLVERALRMRRPPGPYALQAAIAALHAEATRAEDDRLAPDPGALRRADANHADTRRGAEPRGRRGRGARPGTRPRGGRRPRRRPTPSPASAPSTPPAPTCSAASAARTMRRRPTGAPRTSPAAPPSAPSSPPRRAA